MLKNKDFSSLETVKCFIILLINVKMPTVIAAWFVRSLFDIQFNSSNSIYFHLKVLEVDVIHVP